MGVLPEATSCNRGPDGKGTKMPSSTPGEGKWVPHYPSEHVIDKIDEIEI